ncbi:tigger transposable element-derived protein 1-like [Macrobrachium rosenbergii]|uniref:tigger transposable element-derived protein 1-like n=1 Tax=Macrobrachium rosenbergii TaxID=79674 RepID=UPI0034D5D896
MTKHPAPFKAPSSLPKKQRKVMTIEEKVQVLDMLKSGQTASSIGRQLGLNESSECSIKKKEVEIREKVSKSYLNEAKQVSTKRDPNIVKMESALLLWIEDFRKRDIPLQGNVIREKALQLYNKIVEEGTERPQPATLTSTDCGSFQASRGWFDKFAKCFNIRSVKFHGEAASADTEAAESYPETFKGII